MLRRLHYYLRRRRFEAELDEEMAYHRELSGAKQFGNTARWKEESRAASTVQAFGFSPPSRRRWIREDSADGVSSSGAR